MSRISLIPLFLTSLVALAACQGHGATTSILVRATTQPAVRATTPTPVVAASIVAAASPALSPSPSPSPSAAFAVQAAASPIIFHPSSVPTALPSGHASPLPLDAFPTDPPATASPIAPASTAPTVAPTPFVTPTPGAPASMIVVSNTLDVGPGSVGGVVLGPPSVAGNPAVAVGGGTINIVDATDNSKRAVLTVGSDGTYRLGALALRTYQVWVTETGFTADTAPTEVTLSIGLNQNSNTPLVLVKTVAFPTPTP
jgi:hypothetical protein